MVATLAEIARLIGGELEGPEDTVVSGPAAIDEAGPNHITFAAEARYLGKAGRTKAAAVIVPTDAPPLSVPMIRVRSPRLAWCQVLEHFAPPREVREGVHESAVLGEGVKLGKGVSIGPGVVVGDGTRIGDRVEVEAGVVIGRDCRIGNGTRIEANTTIYWGVSIGRNVIIHANCVIGGDGFGYVADGNRQRKVPHLGDVQIEDDVELGALVAIDRGVSGSTVIGRGTKIDNLVQIGHNVKVGANCLIVALAGIAGSTKLGDRVTMAGQSGIVGHVEVGSDTVVAARSVVARDLPAGSFVSGFPARPHKENMKVLALTQKLPEINETVAELKRQVAELTERLDHLQEEFPASGEGC